LENQRTITGEERFAVADGIRIILPAGTAVQSTTGGVLTWAPEVNLTEFHDKNGIWTLTATGVKFITWDEHIGLTPASPPAQAAPAEPSSAYNRAASTCFRAETDWMVTTPLDASKSVTERAEAEGKAKGYLCNQALTKDGPKGVNCFLSAWEAAKGMERVFQGSGQRVYQDKYAACMGR
jgi:hypothetical protein